LVLKPPTKDEPPETEEQAIKAALEFRPELKQLRLALRESQLQERVARHQTLPELSIGGGVGLNGSGEDFGESYSQLGDNHGSWWSAGMQFSVPLDNAVARNDYLMSKIKTKQAQNQLAALEWQVRNSVEADLRALISARLQMQTAEQAREFAEQRSEEYRKYGLAGATTVQDIINAENDLATARNTQLEATETFANGVTELWRDIGVLLDRQGVHIDITKPGDLMGTGR
jgi:outer membrane protein TolC